MKRMLLLPFLYSTLHPHFTSPHIHTTPHHTTIFSLHSLNPPSPYYFYLSPDSETKGMIKSPTPIVSFGGIETFSTAHPHFNNGYSYNLFTELRPVPLPFCSKSNIVHLGESTILLLSSSKDSFNGRIIQYRT